MIDELGNPPPASSARYFSIAGDVAGGGNDGLVDVSSAVGSPGLSPSRDLEYGESDEESGECDALHAVLLEKPGSQPLRMNE